MTRFHRTYRQTSTMPPYQRYAQAYDQSGQVRFALLVHIYLREILALHPVQGRRLLDLACGTGTLAFLMAERGWSVVGVDSSAAMLAMAAERVAENPGATVQFLQGDMRTLAGAVPPAAFDLVTCTYDSLNYMLTHDDLAACFASAALALAPGGLYVADMNTRHFLEFAWGTCAIHEQSGYVQLERSHFEPTSSISTMLLTGFLGDETSGYERFDELHVERAYPPDEVAALFKRAGLTVEASYDSFTLSSPGPETQRIFWVARKPW
ncbi:class I SAM-dependent methyltransferase [Candidatus Chloroploca mongolica]|nr:class I SAM-dependent methyltransferase [Candidatus Chloroploca mongolica]